MKWITLLFLCITFHVCGQTADSCYKTAKQYLEEKKPGQALEQIEKAFAIDSLNEDYYGLKIDCLVALKEWQAVVNTYAKAISLFPRSGYLYNNRGSLLINLGYFDEAILDFNKAMSLTKSDTMFFDILMNRAAARLSKRDFKGAYDDLIQAYHFDSTNIGILSNLGSVCDEVGKGDQTLFYLEKALALQPNDPAIIGNIGFKYQEMGDYKKAIAYFDRALLIEPNEGQTYGNRAFNKMKLGDLKGAEEDIDRSIKLYPANSYAYRTRALIYIEEKLFNKACLDLQIALDKDFTTRYGNEVQELKAKYCK